MDKSMSLQDRIAKRLLSKHSRILSHNINNGKYLNRLKRTIESVDKRILELSAVRVAFSTGQSLVCEVADNDKAQSIGLQKYASLPDGYGMIFPYSPPRPRVAFHMGSVPFPIDIMFVGTDGRITKIVHNIEPGTAGNWGMSHVSAVVEANGGYCRANNIEVGTVVGISKVAQSLCTSCNYHQGMPEFDGRCKACYDNETDSMCEVCERIGPGFSPMCWDCEQEALKTLDIDIQNAKNVESPEVMRNRLRTNFEMTDEEVEEIIDEHFGYGKPNMPPAKASRQAQETFSGPRKDIDPKMLPPSGINPDDRFKGHDLVDVQVDNQPFDGANFDMTIGYDPTKSDELEEVVDPIRQAP